MFTIIYDYHFPILYIIYLVSINSLVSITHYYPINIRTAPRSSTAHPAPRRPPPRCGALRRCCSAPRIVRRGRRLWRHRAWRGNGRKCGKIHLGAGDFTGKMDWFKGKSTGNNGFSHQIWRFPVKFPLNQSIDMRKNEDLAGDFMKNEDLFWWYHKKKWWNKEWW